MAKKASFKNYVLKRQPDSSAVGEFIREAKADRSFPNAASWWDLRGYLIRRDGGERSLIAARSVWKAYIDMGKK
jgi:hypothetical protein